MSNTRTSTLERNGNSSKGIKLASPWSRAITSNSEWTDKVKMFIRFSGLIVLNVKCVYFFL